MRREREGKMPRRKGWKTGENYLDEMQEQKMLHIERNSFWILYVMTAVSVIVQKVLGRSFREYAFEGLCFFVVSVFTVGACIRQGVWDRHLKADGRTNLKVSIVGGVAAAVIATITVCSQYPEVFLRWETALIVFALTFLITFVLCMILINFCTFLYKKRLNRLETMGEDETDD